MKADLHNHTKYSDGKYDIDEIFKMSNLDYIAITDHDNIESLKYKNNRIINGIELSTYYKNKPLHLLGYFYDFDNVKYLIKFLNKQKIRREKRCKKMCKRLKKYYNLEIDYNKIYDESEGIITRSHMAKEISNKYNLSYKEIFSKYLSTTSKAYIKSSNLSFKKGIRILKKSHCITSIAHPCLYDYSIEKIIKYADAIEAIYPENKANNQEYFINLAKANNKIITAGSDFHGDEKHYPLGTSLLEGDYLDDFLKMIKKK